MTAHVATTETYRQQASAITKPDFFVVGAPKCGTTSLYKYLQDHPQIFLPEKKELHYFSRSQIWSNSNGPGDESAVASICLDIDGYRAQYASCPVTKIAGEVSPSYLFYSQVAEDIKAYNKDAKIVVILRNPAKKAFSQYCHMLRSGQETLEFVDALEQENARISQGWNDMWYYTRGAMYSEGVQEYYDVFGRQNVEVLLFEELAAHPQEVMKKLFKFLGVEESSNIETGTVFNEGAGKSRFGKGGMSLLRNEKFKKVIRSFVPRQHLKRLESIAMKFLFEKKPKMSRTVYKKLIADFDDDIVKLERLLNRKTGWR